MPCMPCPCSRCCWPSLAMRAARHRPHALVLHVTGLGYIAASRTPKAWLARNLTFGMIRVPAANGRRVAIGGESRRHALRSSRAASESQPHNHRSWSRRRSGGVPGPAAARQHPAPRRLCRPARPFQGSRKLGRGPPDAARRAASLWILRSTAPSDAHNPDAVTRAKSLAEWKRRPGLSCPGHVTDVRTGVARYGHCVVPTLGGEGVPRALLEAAACARPVVASDVSGCKHFLRDGIEGALVPPGDADRLADALDRLAATRNCGAVREPQRVSGCWPATRRRRYRTPFAMPMSRYSSDALVFR